jgi:RNA polymerase sigma factor (sigma-70 family)
MNKKQLKELELLSDEELISRLIVNDTLVIEYLFFHKCSALFDRLINVYFNYKIEKHELINEFYLYLCQDNWYKLRQFGQRSSLNTWLTVVAFHFFIKKADELTENVKNSHLIIENNQSEDTSENSAYQYYDISKYELYDAISKISNPRYRWVLLSELRGLSVKEMAKQLKTTVINIYNLKKRSKAQLVKLLSEEDNV